MHKISYSIGVLVGSNLKTQVIPEDINLEDLYKGLSTVLQNGNLAMSEMEAQQLGSQYLKEVANKLNMQAFTKETEFFEENAKREGVVSKPSGLQYEILEEGEGRKPRLVDHVTVHYEGKLLDGSIFDSSVQRGQPASFQPQQLIQGWQEALQLMPEGSKWRLYIPSRLGYGPKGAGQSIPPNATLIFDLELIQVGR